MSGLDCFSVVKVMYNMLSCKADKQLTITLVYKYLFTLNQTKYVPNLKKKQLKVMNTQKTESLN